MRSDVVCASGVELLGEYVEGVLTEDVRAGLEAHVAGCPRCAAFQVAYRETPRILREATSAPLTLDQEASLMAFLRARRH